MICSRVVSSRDRSQQPQKLLRFTQLFARNHAEVNVRWACSAPEGLKIVLLLQTRQPDSASLFSYSVTFDSRVGEVVIMHSPLDNSVSELFEQVLPYNFYIIFYMSMC